MAIQFYTFDSATGAVEPFAGTVVAWAGCGLGMRQIQAETFGNLFVSTFFAGIDLRMAPEDDPRPPLLFETQCRHRRAGVICQRRTETFAQASAAHEAIAVWARGRSSPRFAQWRRAARKADRLAPWRAGR